MPAITLPIGISFFTFHAISYVVDVARRDAVAQKGPIEAALYLLFFPQLIAGPIIRYREIADQLPARAVRIDDHTITVVAPDRPGVFSRVAGVLALNGLDVLEAAAASENGMALSQFTVASSFGSTIDWDRVEADLERSLAGRLALSARLAERAKAYARPGAPPRAPEVRFDNEATHRATIIEVHATDGIGVLNRITRALAELDLDIRTAKVQTLGDEVVDAFYVLDADGEKITDPDHQSEVRRALLFALR